MKTRFYENVFINIKTAKAHKLLFTALENESANELIFAQNLSFTARREAYKTNFYSRVCLENLSALIFMQLN